MSNGRNTGASCTIRYHAAALPMRTNKIVRSVLGSRHLGVGAAGVTSGCEASGGVIGDLAVKELFARASYLRGDVCTTKPPGFSIRAPVETRGNERPPCGQLG